MDQPYPGTVTLSLEDYDELNKAYQNQDPMTRQERIASTTQATAVCAGIALCFVAATAGYYWISDKFEQRSIDRKVALHQARQDIPQK